MKFGLVVIEVITPSGHLSNINEILGGQFLNSISLKTHSPKFSKIRPNFCRPSAKSIYKLQRFSSSIFILVIKSCIFLKHKELYNQNKIKVVDIIASMVRVLHISCHLSFFGKVILRQIT